MDNILYYGCIEGLKDTISSFIKEKYDCTYTIEEPKEDCMDICVGSNEIKIAWKSVISKPRSMSVPFPFKGVLEVALIRNEGDESLAEGLIQRLLAYSNEEIGAIIKDMPILDMVSSEYGGALKDIALIWRDHFLEENIGLLSACVKAGIEPEYIMAFDKGDSTLHRREVTNTFAKLGFQVDLLDNMSVDHMNNTSELERAMNKVKSFVDKCTAANKKVIIVDDGAFVTKLLPEDRKGIIGVLEVTEMGLRRIKNSSTANNLPILDVAKSDLKRYITYPEIAASAVKRLHEILGGEKLIGRRAVILGFGDIGMPMCRRLRSLGLNVVVVDTDPLKLIMAAEEGFVTYRSALEAVKAESPFIVIGATGYISLSLEAVESMPDMSYITAVATSDMDVFRNELGNPELYTLVPGYGRQYYIKGKRVTMLGDGRSMNLFQSEAIPNRGNDVFKAGIFLSIVLMSKKYMELPGGLNKDIVNAWFSEVKLLDKYYDMYFAKGNQEKNV